MFVNVVDDDRNEHKDRVLYLTKHIGLLANGMRSERQVTSMLCSSASVEVISLFQTNESITLLLFVVVVVVAFDSMASGEMLLSCLIQGSTQLIADF